MKKYKITTFHKIVDPIYRKNIFIFWMVKDTNKKFFQKAIKKIVDKEEQVAILRALDTFYEEQEKGRSAGYCMWDLTEFGSCAVFVNYQFKETDLPIYLAALSHELNHATFHILDRVGVKYLTNDQAHEPFTYYQEFLMTSALRAII